MRPHDGDQRLLISSPVRFIGEAEEDGFLLTHAWRRAQQGKISFEEGPNARYAFTVIFQTAPLARQAGIIIPDYSYTADPMCDYLSILFGKRFDGHGSIQNHGSFYVPDLTSWNLPINKHLPFTSDKTRKDLPIELNLDQICRLYPILLNNKMPQSFVRSFQAAAKFYRLGLINAESDPEVGFLQLITSAEIVAANVFKKQSFLAKEVEQSLRVVEERLEDGKIHAKLLRSNLYSVKQKFLAMIIRYCDNEKFFSSTDDLHPFASFSKENFMQAVKSAYDIRSKYVHTGVAFGRWLAPRNNWLADIPAGVPSINEKAIANLLSKSSTYLGLERIVRYCIVGYAKDNGLDLAS